MATDSVSAHVAAQQKKWEEYLAKHAVEKIYRDMTAEMIAEQPESPARRAAPDDRRAPPIPNACVFTGQIHVRLPREELPGGHGRRGRRRGAALLKDAPRAATVTASSKLSTVRIDRATFKRMIGDISAVKKDYAKVK